MAREDYPILPAELLRLATSFSLSQDGTITLNVLEEDESEDYESEFYTPTMRVTPHARKFYRQATDNYFRQLDRELDQEKLPSLIKESELYSLNPRIYTIAQAIILEMVSVTMYTGYGQRNVRDTTRKDMEMVRENILFVADYCSTHEELYHLISPLRELYIGLGYVRGRLPKIQQRVREQFGMA